MIELGLEKKELKGKKSDKKDAQFDRFVKSAIAIIEWFARLCSSFGDGMKREYSTPSLQLAFLLKKLFLGILCDVLDKVSIPMYSPYYHKRKRIQERRKKLRKSKEEGEDKLKVSMDIDKAEEGQREKFVKMLLEMDHLLPVAVGKKVQDLYFNLLGDATFKRKFAFYFAGSYCFFNDLLLEISSWKEPKQRRVGGREAYQNLMHLSVQLFTVPNIVPHLVSEGRLLENMLPKMYDLLAQGFHRPSEAEEGPMELDPDSSVIKNRLYYHISNDLSSLMQFRTIAKYLVYKGVSESSSGQNR